MAVTEEHVESWGSRLGSSIKGVLAGLLLFLAAFPLLFWNEGRAVNRARVLDSGAASCITIKSDAIQPDNEGKLVHTTGKLATPDILTDPVFGISVNAIRFSRKVEMYQWRETSRTREEKQLGGSVKKVTVYEYQKVWSDEIINSSGFKEPGHTNPAEFIIGGEESLARNVTLGAFTLDHEIIARIGGGEDYKLPADYTFPAGINGVTALNRIYIPTAEPVAVSGTTPAPVLSGTRSPVTSPAVGDIRISFEVIYPHDLSIVAQQTGGGFTACPVNNDTILLLADSVRSAEQMFQAAHSANSLMTWLIRLGGTVMMFAGLTMILKPLSVLGDLIPLIGDLIELGTSLIAFCISLPCALITIAVAWLFYRPLIAIPLLLAAGGMIWFLIRKRKAAARRKAGTDTAPAA